MINILSDSFSHIFQIKHFFSINYQIEVSRFTLISGHSLQTFRIWLSFFLCHLLSKEKYGYNLFTSLFFHGSTAFSSYSCPIAAEYCFVDCFCTFKWLIVFCKGWWWRQILSGYSNHGNSYFTSYSKSISTCGFSFTRGRWSIRRYQWYVSTNQTFL